MIAGHFGVAAAVKGHWRSTPLWALMLASVWLDVVFIPFVVCGLESVEPVVHPGGYGSLLIHAHHTHSLAGMIFFSLMLGLIVRPWLGHRAAWVVASVSASHWICDFVVHRPDMPLLPGNMGQLPLLGLGLWRFPNAAASLEGVVLLLGTAMYARAAVEVCASERKSMRLAYGCVVMMLIFGVVTLALDFTSTT